MGAGIAEKVLSVMESILLEASSSLANVDRASIVRQTSTGPVIVQEQSQLSQLLDHIETPYVVSIHGNTISSIHGDTICSK